MTRVGSIDVPKATLEMRKVLTVKIGDVLIFSPGLERTAGENADFFSRYDGMKAEILGFGSDRITSTTTYVMKSSNIPEVLKDKPVVGSFSVRFENGAELELFSDFFLVP